MKKKCIRCNKTKEESDFIPRYKGERENWNRPCKNCNANRAKKYRDTHPEYRKKEAAASVIYRAKNRIRLKENFIKWRTRIKVEVLGHYSKGIPKCRCCGESHIEFLSIDHIDCGGKKHFIGLNRRGAGFYVWLRNQ